MSRATLVAVAFALLAVGGCGGAKSGVRAPTAAERSGIDAAVDRAWNEYAGFPLQPWVRQLGFRDLRRQGYRPQIVSVRVSRADPALATAAARLLDAGGRRTPYGAVLLLTRSGSGWGLVDGPTTIFPQACVSVVPRAVRALLCPDPWTVLGVRHAGLPRAAQVAVVGRRWRTIELPGAVCGAPRPIRLRWGHGGGWTVIHSIYWPWYPAIDVYANGPVRIPDVNGDGSEDAYYEVTCDNTGGTGDGILRRSDVVFSADENVAGALVRPLGLLGIVSPQQPYSYGDFPPFNGPLEVVMRSINPARSVLIAPELWYGSLDPSSCCPSGRATTIWTYTHGRLRPLKTVVAIQPAEVR